MGERRGTEGPSKVPQLIPLLLPPSVAHETRNQVNPVVEETIERGRREREEVPRERVREKESASSACLSLG